ncbi:MAG: DUF362 domain-containing protein, partial [Phycisphaerales bacterium]
MRSAGSKENHGCIDSGGKREGGVKRWWLRLLLPATGLAALLWFLVRVIPKPSRASYPCQRAAFPLAAGFVAWVAAVVGSLAAFRRARVSSARRRYVVVVACIVAGVGAMWMALSLTGEKLVLGDAEAANQPVGVARGIYPGRVVWVHDPEAARWEGPGRGHPWQDRSTDPERVEQMMSRSLRELTGAGSDGEAWERLFKYHNKQRGKGEVGYKAGEKVMIKVNFVGMLWRMGTVNEGTYELEKWQEYMNTSPQVIGALLGQLTGAGVRQSDITVGDTLAYFCKEYRDLLAKRFPDVRYMVQAGKFGRVKAERSKVALYWSCKAKTEKTDYIPKCYVDAEYLINLANLKAHGGTGVTLCAKNHYGSLIRWPTQGGFYDLHGAA